MSCNILIGGFIQNGDLESARQVFDEMPERNVVTWNAMVAGCAGLKDLNAGMQVHEYVVKSGFEFNLVVGSSLAHMYMKSGSLGEGERVIKAMPIRNVVACNTLIAGRAQNGFSEGALDQYNMMKMAGFRPDKITFVSVISSCSELATLGQGQQIHAEAIKTGASTVVGVISSLISMYSRCGCLDESVKAFLEREEADVVLWSSMIAAYGFHGKGEEAIELFNRMDQVGLDANDITFLSLLYACSHCGLKDKGLQFFNLMIEKYGLEPRLEHYTCVVDLLGRSGCLEEAEGFIRTMPVKKDAIIWKTLLSACKIHKNADIAKRIAEEVLRLDPQDSAPYVLLSNIQASAKRWQDVSEVRKVMRDRRVKKEPGISWFEVKNQVHQFCMGDKSHPQSMEIDMYLKELTWEMKLRGYVPDTGSVLHDMDAEEKEHNLAHHSEKLAIAFALMNTPEGVPIRVMKNLRVCSDCHVAIKYISEIENREIILYEDQKLISSSSNLWACGLYFATLKLATGFATYMGGTTIMLQMGIVISHPRKQTSKGTVPDTSPPASLSRNRRNLKAIIALSCAGALLIFVVTIVTRFVMLRPSCSEDGEDCMKQVPGSLVRFSYEQLCVATEDFKRRKPCSDHNERNSWIYCSRVATSNKSHHQS
ncbi:hypothetical protein HYC85_015136 [Camellia sinensis]|uniref:DYW domain-containing protein n=1 Tax=Camellia sinensis TaxID=4442 RepID=A0A7J7H8J6_CAMSI|nr:hypothetical protein HYC85_015136 [Camellia sinensis]